MFDKVHVSEDDPRSVKFLVAYGREATFIAFRGARDFEYLGRDRDKLPSSSDLHATVNELVDSFLLPDSKLLEELCLSGKRIIFCGHRLGGAVAQMVTIRYWKGDKIDSPKSVRTPAYLILIFHRLIHFLQVLPGFLTRFQYFLGSCVDYTVVCCNSGHPLKIDPTIRYYTDLRWSLKFKFKNKNN